MAKDADSKSFLLRVDSATMEALEQWAASEFRSRRAGRKPKQ